MNRRALLAAPLFAAPALAQAPIAMTIAAKQASEYQRGVPSPW